jgi:hypothetical protein
MKMIGHHAEGVDGKLVQARCLLHQLDKGQRAVVVRENGSARLATKSYEIPSPSAIVHGMQPNIFSAKLHGMRRPCRGGSANYAEPAVAAFYTTSAQF